MNGVTIDPLAGFEIITDVGGVRWFAKVVGEEGEEIRLQPAWEMVPRQFIPVQNQNPAAPPNTLTLSAAGIFPLFDRASMPTVRVRWASRVALKDFAEEDQKFFRAMLKASEDKSRAARAGLML
jgi:hypothetical protein